MKKRTATLASLLLVTAISVVAASTAFAFAKGSTDGVVGVLLKKYPLTTTTAFGAQITHDGTQMILKQAGIYSYPAKAFASKLEGNSFDSGKIKGPFMASNSCTTLHCHVLQSGEKVYVTKIESKSDTLTFTIISADNIDGGDGAERYEAAVNFKMKNLSESSPDDVEATVEAVMAPSDDSDSSKKDDPPAKAPSPPPPTPTPAPAQCAAVPSKPAGPLPELSKGERWSDVLKAYGMPTEIIDAGTGKKVIFIYKDPKTKIIFIDDKISDVE